MVKFVKSKAATPGPSSAIGITRFFDADTKGPKLSPYFVIGITFILIVAIVVIKLITRV
ncbi:MAG: preprotein translocase subunit Sec61beta [Candidatus Diapherotrites archaeon]|nr:preprotein translocase subunit Sec61beta [Candidatus Diapherotrites archaeon]